MLGGGCEAVCEVVRGVVVGMGVGMRLGWKGTKGCKLACIFVTLYLRDQSEEIASIKVYLRQGQIINV